MQCAPALVSPLLCLSLPARCAPGRAPDLASAQQRAAHQERELSALRALAGEKDAALTGLHAQLAAARDELARTRQQLQGAAGREGNGKRAGLQAML
jgi:hypothetical protein